MLFPLLKRGIHVINLHLLCLDAKVVPKGRLFAGGLENGVLDSCICSCKLLGFAFSTAS